MYSRFVLINCPGLGVGNVQNSSSSEHSLERLLKYAYDNSLNVDLSGLEEIGLQSFVKYSSSTARKTSVTARLASRNVHGADEFSAFNEMGGGDDEHLPVFSLLSEINSDVFVTLIGNDESIVPAHEFIECEDDMDMREVLADVVSAPLTRNELVIASAHDYRRSAEEGNATLTVANCVYFASTIKEVMSHIGASDALMVLSTSALDVTRHDDGYRNELTPMLFFSPTVRTNDLGLRLLSDVGPSIAEFFDYDRSQLIGASMGKWLMAYEEQSPNPHVESQSPLHS